MSESLIELFRRVADLERKIANQMRHGTVHSVDAAKGTIRLKLGEGANGKPFLSPAIPYAQMAGALKVHTPPSVGQQMTLLAASGDLRQAVAMPMTWSNSNAAPSQSGEENVLTFGSVRIELKGDKLKITAPEIELVAGGHSQKLTGAGTEFTSGTIKHDGVKIDKTHKHTDVEPGGALSGPPGG